MKQLKKLVAANIVVNANFNHIFLHQTLIGKLALDWECAFNPYSRCRQAILIHETFTLMFGRGISKDK